MLTRSHIPPLLARALESTYPTDLGRAASEGFAQSLEKLKAAGGVLH